MTKPRCNQICLDATPYYHVVSRCVRRAFLCGVDQYTGESYEHRREWITDRLALLAEVFCIDISAYAVMSNHYHLVLHINQQAALSLSNDQVLERWSQLFKLPLVAQQQLKGKPLSQPEKMLLRILLQKWRHRLYDISWLMRCLNEPLARMANEEDDCTGRFWEGRYKSQALLDDAAILACMNYVDLNPIRACMADTPENSDFTSIQSRIHAHAKKQRKCRPIRLQKFIGDYQQEQADGINFSLADYLQLVDYSGRAILENKRGYIDGHLSPILTRLGIDQQAWLENITQFEKQFNLAVGTVEKLQAFAGQLKQKWLKGKASSQRLYQTASG